VPEFLESIRDANKHLVLVTNAHIKSLSLKMEKTQLAGHFDKVICAHDYGLPKEQPDFWDKLKVDVPFENTSTLLIDDSLPVLRSAHTYGIAHLLAVHKPDTQQPPKDVEEFDAVINFLDIMPYLNNKA
jgi:putative hydrolase of the HAD superfamily